MPRCPSCEATTLTDAHFCPQCGVRFDRDAPTSTQRQASLSTAGARLNRKRRSIAAHTSLGLALLALLLIGVMLTVHSNLLAGPSHAVAGQTTNRTTLPQSIVVPHPASRVETLFSTILLKDRFDNPQLSSLGEDANENAVYTFVDGSYEITLKKPNYIGWSPFAGTYDDASIEVEVTLDKAKNNAAGLIFHYQDEENFYVFLVSNDEHYELELYKQNRLTTLIDWTESAAIKDPGEPNRLRVDMDGSHIRLFANNTLLDEISDDTFTSGALALVATTFGERDATITFDNLIVRGAK